jgi:parallel beta-helix repeat protein
MKLKIFSTLLALVLALSVSLVMALPVAANGGVYNVEKDTYYGTIQAAVDNADPGNHIEVAAGTYAGAIVDKDLTISGEPDGSSIINTGVPYKDGGTTPTTAFRLDGNADGTEIYNFTINNNQPASFYFAVFARGADNVIIDSLAVNDTVQGITNWGGSDWEITNNVITDTVAAGGGGIGIYLGARPANKYYETPLPVCSDNLVQYNTINATATAEAYSCPGICLSLDLRYEGYDNIGGTEDVSGNQILDNDITATGVNNGIGIEVGTILGDSEDDPLRTDTDAIAAIMTAADVHDNTVQDNTTDGADTGIYFYNVTNLTVTLNEIENSVSDGIYAEHGQSGTVITNNTFTNNEVQLTDDTDDTATLDPLNIAAILAGNTFDRAVTVDHTGASLLHAIWSGIQDGIDNAVGGDTVTCAAGTYDEEVVIDESLTLISDTGDYRTTGVILNGPIALSNVDGVTVQGFKLQDCSATGYKHVIYTGGTADNITIHANSFESCEGLNIHIYYGGDTWFENWTITDNKITDATGTNASGIWVQRLRNSTISSNEISNTTYAGMILDRLENVTVSNNNISNTPRKGIQVATSPDCNVVIEDNFITNTNTLNAADEGAITIYPDVTNIHIENNTLVNSYRGFSVCEDKPGVVTDVHVNYNNIYNNEDFGVACLALDGGTLDALQNWWGADDGPSGVGLGSGDAVSANVDYDPWLGETYAPTKTTGTATGSGDVDFAPDAGALEALTPIDEGSLPTAGKPTFGFPHGLFSFRIVGLELGQTVTVTITFPAPVPIGSQYWKCQGGIWYPISMGSNDGDKVVTIELTDGGIGDADGVNGIINDPGGPAYMPPVGGELFPVNKLSILAPWLTLALLLVLGGGFWVMRKRFAR